MRKLTVADIADLRAYERERDEFRRRIIEMKKRRRIALGPFMTIVFENTDTMRFQVQEMARAERMLREDQIAHEVATYNELIPGDGELSGTLFLELDSPEALREWLPKLVGIQRAVAIRVDGTEARGEPQDEERLTREETTAAVHFLRFRLRPDTVAAFPDAAVAVVVDHPAYAFTVPLTDAQRAELAADLAPSASG